MGSPVLINRPSPISPLPQTGRHSTQDALVSPNPATHSRYRSPGPSLLTANRHDQPPNHITTNPVPQRYPGEPVTSTRASQFSSNAGYNISSPSAQNPPASDIDFVYLAGRDMVTPGVYTLLIVARSGTPRVGLQVRRRRRRLVS
jgi:hypothetical protein